MVEANLALILMGIMTTFCHSTLLLVSTNVLFTVDTEAPLLKYFLLVGATLATTNAIFLLFFLGQSITMMNDGTQNTRRLFSDRLSLEKQQESSSVNAQEGFRRRKRSENGVRQPRFLSYAYPPQMSNLTPEEQGGTISERITQSDSTLFHVPTSILEGVLRNLSSSEPPMYSEFCWENHDLVRSNSSSSSEIPTNLSWLQSSSIPTMLSQETTTNTTTSSTISLDRIRETKNEKEEEEHE
jgi:hypothetical protein